MFSVHRGCDIGRNPMYGSWRGGVMMMLSPLIFLGDSGTKQRAPLWCATWSSSERGCGVTSLHKTDPTPCGRGSLVEEACLARWVDLSERTGGPGVPKLGPLVCCPATNGGTGAWYGPVPEFHGGGSDAKV
jgi:hypothetical protein